MQKLLKDWTIRLWNDHSINPLTHQIILKIFRFLKRPLRSYKDPRVFPRDIIDGPQCMLLQKVFHLIMKW